MTKMKKESIIKFCKEHTHLVFLTIMFVLSEAMFFLLYALPETSESILTTIICGVVWTGLCYVWEFYINPLFKSKNPCATK